MIGIKSANPLTQILNLALAPIILSAACYLCELIIKMLATYCSATRMGIISKTDIERTDNQHPLKFTFVIINTILFSIIEYLQNDGQIRLGLLLAITIEFTLVPPVLKHLWQKLKAKFNQHTKASATIDKII